MFLQGKEEISLHSQSQILFSDYHLWTLPPSSQFNSAWYFPNMEDMTVKSHLSENKKRKKMKKKKKAVL